VPFNCPVDVWVECLLRLNILFLLSPLHLHAPVLAVSVLSLAFHHLLPF
jgi:hypothetical protein